MVNDIVCHCAHCFSANASNHWLTARDVVRGIKFANSSQFSEGSKSMTKRGKGMKRKGMKEKGEVEE